MLLMGQVGYYFQEIPVSMWYSRVKYIIEINYEVQFRDKLMKMLSQMHKIMVSYLPYLKGADILEE